MKPKPSLRPSGMKPKLQRLDAELKEFVEGIRPSKDDHKARMKVVRRFGQIVQSLWEEARVEVFGSLATGLYLPDGDLDIVVSLPSFSNVSTSEIFDSIAHAVRSYGLAVPSSIEILPDIRVPLLKFSTTPTSKIGSFKLDVSLEHARDGPLGATACLSILDKLDKNGTAKSDRAKGLIFVIKTLLQSKNLASSRGGGLGGMSIFCLVVSFIQHDFRSEEERSPGTDLLAFLDFAATFNYERYAISVVGKGLISLKSTQRWTDDSKPRRVCIQHPTDLDRNLSCGTYKIYELQAAFGKTYRTLLSLLKHPSKLPAHQNFLDRIFERPFNSSPDLDAPLKSRSPSPYTPDLSALTPAQQDDVELSFFD